MKKQNSLCSKIDELSNYVRSGFIEDCIVNGVQMKTKFTIREKSELRLHRDNTNLISKVMTCFQKNSPEHVIILLDVKVVIVENNEDEVFLISQDDYISLVLE